VLCLNRKSKVNAALSDIIFLTLLLLWGLPVVGWQADARLSRDVANAQAHTSISQASE